MNLRGTIEHTGTVICDWDDVIQCIGIPWIQSTLIFKSVFEEYFDFSKIDENNLGESIFKRDTYYYNDWLKRDELKSLPKNIYEVFMKLYNDDKNLYHKAPFLTMKNFILEISDLSDTNEIIFLTSLTRNDDERKTEIFNKVFKKYNPEKFRIVNLPPKHKKDNWIKENCPNYNCFIDDRFDLICDVINNTNSEGKCFIMPEYGFNTKQLEDVKKEFYIHCYKNRITFATYESKILIKR